MDILKSVIIAFFCSIFCVLSGTWTLHHSTGTPPPALIGFTFTQVGQQAVLFGGRDKSQGTEVNDVYTLDLDKWVGHNVSLWSVL